MGPGRRCNSPNHCSSASCNARPSRFESPIPDAHLKTLRRHRRRRRRASLFFVGDHFDPCTPLPSPQPLSILELYPNTQVQSNHGPVDGTKMHLQLRPASPLLFSPTNFPATTATTSQSRRRRRKKKSKSRKTLPQPGSTPSVQSLSRSTSPSLSSSDARSNSTLSVHRRSAHAIDLTKRFVRKKTAMARSLLGCDQNVPVEPIATEIFGGVNTPSIDDVDAAKDKQSTRTKDYQEVHDDIEYHRAQTRSIMERGAEDDDYGKRYSLQGEHQRSTAIDKITRNPGTGQGKAKRVAWRSCQGGVLWGQCIGRRHTTMAINNGKEGTLGSMSGEITTKALGESAAHRLYRLFIDELQTGGRKVILISEESDAFNQVMRLQYEEKATTMTLDGIDWLVVKSYLRFYLQTRKRKKKRHDDDHVSPREELLEYFPPGRPQPGSDDIVIPFNTITKLIQSKNDLSMMRPRLKSIVDVDCGLILHDATLYYLRFFSPVDRELFAGALTRILRYRLD